MSQVKDTVIVTGIAVAIVLGLINFYMLTVLGSTTLTIQVGNLFGLSLPKTITLSSFAMIPIASGTLTASGLVYRTDKEEKDKLLMEDELQVCKFCRVRFKSSNIALDTKTNDYVAFCPGCREPLPITTYKKWSRFDSQMPPLTGIPETLEVSRSRIEPTPRPSIEPEEVLIITVPDIPRSNKYISDCGKILRKIGNRHKHICHGCGIRDITGDTKVDGDNVVTKFVCSKLAGGCGYEWTENGRIEGSSTI